MRGNYLLLLVFGAGLVLAEPVDSGDLKPERTVTGRAITSTHDPAVRIEFNKVLGYAGGERFVLYGTADCELHLFVDANDGGIVRRMFWIQFEGYLPGNNDAYNYKSQERATIGGLEFILDSAPRSYVGYQPRAGSDGEHVTALLQSKGYRLPANALWLRMVHLTDASKRRELMIIYVEDLAPLHLIVGDFENGGKAANTWPTVAKGLLERAEKGMKIRRKTR